jgi:hypothetical protein
MSQLIHEQAHPVATPDAALVSFLHPDDVLAERALTTAEKRAILASWASDERTVVGEPTLRQLPCGAIVRLYEIQRALARLDRVSTEVYDRRPSRWSTHRRARLAKWLTRRGSRPDDDDHDPPPVPAASARPTILTPAAA